MNEASVAAVIDVLSDPRFCNDAPGNYLERAGRLLLQAIDAGALSGPEHIAFVTRVRQRAEQQAPINGYISAWSEAVWLLRGETGPQDLERSFSDDRRLVIEALRREIAARRQSAGGEPPAVPEVGAATERPDQSSPPTFAAATGAPVFGITLDHVNRRVRREGYDREVDLFSTQIGWHIFKVILSAAPEQATLDALQSDYPGEFDARATAINDLNRRLRPLKIKVRDRTLALLG